MLPALPRITVVVMLEVVEVVKVALLAESVLIVVRLGWYTSQMFFDCC